MGFEQRKFNQENGREEKNRRSPFDNLRMTADCPLQTVRALIIIILVITVSFSGTAYAQGNLFQVLGGQRAGTSSFPFLKIGVGARAAGMGEAFVGIADDASALYWNPAGIAQTGGAEFIGTHTAWPADINYEFLGYVQPVGRNIYLGASAGFLHMDPMEVRTVYNPHGTGEYFNYSDMVLGASFAMRMTDRFSFGVTLKHVQENLAGLIMDGQMLDLGTFYWTGFKSLRFSVALTNFGPQVAPAGTYEKPLIAGGTGEFKYSEFSPPTVFRIGSAMNLIETGAHVLTGSIQLNHPVDNAENFVAGGEYKFMDMLALRGGYKLNADEGGLAFGAGVEIPMIGMEKFRFDYAYTDFGRLTSVHRFAIGFEL
ncbi:MAG: PorV/PorQ family protein [Candidatus Marinimicrobia bacterium]|nr:PorV/PorQ family protein [Candidatus Neomarinimicrobiota bacterium]MCF7829075.1 PorV/PorQ family protein [Candidatus Neomarinimicrobiota bacterium]MCF7881526.1 PorV/PorQ family protein [Candidatus Neomarinimicrobiota bacterium]